MPNWVFNQTVFYSTSQNTIQDFHEKLTKWASEPAMKYAKLGFNPSKWLGNILTSAGFPYQEILDGKHGRCRGEINHITPVSKMSLDGKTYNFFVVSTATAWERMTLMWLNILKKLYGENNNINLAFTSDEESSEFFEMYNPDNILRLIGYTGKEEYIFKSFIEESENLNKNTFKTLTYLPDEDEKVLTKEETMEILSNISKTYIDPSSFKDNLNDYIQKCNNILENINDSSINVIPITYIQNLNKEI